MLFTTFLLALAVAAALFLGALLFKPTRDNLPTHIPVATIAVLAIATALTALGLVMV
jgi:hypothetical protein